MSKNRSKEEVLKAFGDNLEKGQVIVVGFEPSTNSEDLINVQLAQLTKGEEAGLAPILNGLLGTTFSNDQFKFAWISVNKKKKPEVASALSEGMELRDLLGKPDLNIRIQTVQTTDPTKFLVDGEIRDSAYLRSVRKVGGQPVKFVFLKDGKPVFSSNTVQVVTDTLPYDDVILDGKESVREEDFLATLATAKAGQQEKELAS